MQVSPQPGARASLLLTRRRCQKIRQFAFRTPATPVERAKCGRGGGGGAFKKTKAGRAGARPSEGSRYGLVEGVAQAELDLVDVREERRRLERLAEQLAVDDAEAVGRRTGGVDAHVRERLRDVGGRRVH